MTSGNLLQETDGNLPVSLSVPYLHEVLKSSFQTPRHDSPLCRELKNAKKLETGLKQRFLNCALTGLRTWDETPNQ